MTKTRTRVLITALAVGGGITAAIVANGPTSVPAESAPAAVAAAPGHTDPYRTDGTWLVPVEVAPGTYRVEDRITAPDFGYYEVCATKGCTPFGTGELIGNGIVEDGVSTYIVIPETAATVHLQGINLTRVEG